jgi:uncharacterized protein (DUF697 family)
MADAASRLRDYARRLGAPVFAIVERIAAAAVSDASEDEARRAAAAEAPVIWLLGKVQSGKSSIVERLTGAAAAEIGEGFRPVTRSARLFDFPAEAPLIRFLDTRGLGEAGYDPSEDLALSETKAHLLIAVMRAGDPAQQSVIAALEGIRRRHPDWPVVVAQTWLHGLYAWPPRHPVPYPFTGGPADASLAEVPSDLGRALQHQRSLFAGLPGTGAIRFVPIDLTRSEDGLPPADYGLGALIDALSKAAPEAVAIRLAALVQGESLRIGGRAHGLILGYAFAAAASDVVPAVGLVAVPSLQGAMLHALSRRYAILWRREDIASFLGSLGTTTLIRYGLGFALRQLVKLVPVYGQTAGAATAAGTSFAVTYALGAAARLYLRTRRAGERASDEAIKAAYAEGLGEAFRIFPRKRDGAP